MHLLITGASGFIGRNLLAGVPGDWRVVATYHRSTDFVEFLQRNGLRHVEPLCLDLARDGAGARLAAVSSEVDACIFLAANGNPAHAVEDAKLDMMANTETLVE